MAREYNNMEALHVFFKSGAESEMRDAARNLRWGQVDAQESSIAKGWAHGVSGLIDQEVRSKRVCDHMRRVLTVCSVLHKPAGLPMCTAVYFCRCSSRTANDMKLVT